MKPFNLKSIPVQVLSAAKEYLATHNDVLAYQRLDAANKKALAKELSGLPEGAFLVIENNGKYIEVGYAPSTAVQVDVEGWFALYEQGVITKEDFLAALSVSKSEAESRTGQLVVSRICKEVTGKVLDVRLKLTDLTQSGMYTVAEPAPVKAKPALSKPATFKPSKRVIKQSV